MVTHTYIHTYTHDNYYNPRCAHAHRGLIIMIIMQAKCFLGRIVAKQLVKFDGTREEYSDSSNETRTRHQYPWISRDVSIKMQLSLVQ